MNTGFFLTLEGGEGAGKSTLSARLAAALAAAGHDVVATREPGGTDGALAVRALLVRGDGDRWSPLSEAMLVCAARADHVSRLIQPALQRGAIVICDRFRDSTRAYQVAGRGLPLAAEATLAELVGAPNPDLTLLLDLDVRQGVGRSRGAGVGESRYEAMDLAFHERVRAGFLAIAAAEGDRVHTLDASQSADQVFAEALAIVQSRLKA